MTDLASRAYIIAERARQAAMNASQLASEAALKAQESSGALLANISTQIADVAKSVAEGAGVTQVTPSHYDPHFYDPNYTPPPKSDTPGSEYTLDGGSDGTRTPDRWTFVGERTPEETRAWLERLEREFPGSVIYEKEPQSPSAMQAPLTPGSDAEEGPKLTVQQSLRMADEAMVREARSDGRPTYADIVRRRLPSGTDVKQVGG